MKATTGPSLDYAITSPQKSIKFSANSSLVSLRDECGFFANVSKFESFSNALILLVSLRAHSKGAQSFNDVS